MDIDQIIHEAAEAAFLEGMPQVPMQSHCWTLSQKSAIKIIDGMKKIVLLDDPSGEDIVKCALDDLGPLWACQSHNGDFPCAKACAKRTAMITEALQLDRSKQRFFLLEVQTRLDKSAAQREAIRNAGSKNKKKVVGKVWA